MANKKTVIEKKKITPEIICDVINGKYGLEAGKERNAALRADGINPSLVTKKINELQKIAEELIPLFNKAGEYAGCLLLLVDE